MRRGQRTLQGWLPAIPLLYRKVTVTWFEQLPALSVTE